MNESTIFKYQHVPFFTRFSIFTYENHIYCYLHLVCQHRHEITVNITSAFSSYLK